MSAYNSSKLEKTYYRHFQRQNPHKNDTLNHMGVNPAVKSTSCSPLLCRFSEAFFSLISIAEQTTNTALTKNACQVCCSNRSHARLVSVFAPTEKLCFRSFALTSSALPLFVKRNAMLVPVNCAPKSFRATS